MRESPTGIFKRETKILLLSAIALIAITLIAALGGPYLFKQISIDRCLDSGGKFNYQTNECICSKTIQND
jgi:hypothetical protein